MKRFKKLMAILMATALIMSIAAISASAEDTYTPVNGTNTQFNKYLVVDSDTNIPAISFNFTVVLFRQLPLIFPALPSLSPVYTVM